MRGTLRAMRSETAGAIIRGLLLLLVLRAYCGLRAGVRFIIRKRNSHIRSLYCAP